MGEDGGEVKGGFGVGRVALWYNLTALNAQWLPTSEQRFASHHEEVVGGGVVVVNGVRDRMPLLTREECGLVLGSTKNIQGTVGLWYAVFGFTYSQQGLPEVEVFRVLGLLGEVLDVDVLLV